MACGNANQVRETKSTLTIKTSTSPVKIKEEPGNTLNLSVITPLD
jgi:hypothetical protein